MSTPSIPVSKFYPAENYHRDYFNQNSSKGYCQLVIVPKVDKFKDRYTKLLKETSSAADISK